MTPTPEFEAVARAIAQASGIEICSDASYAQSSFRGKAQAALDALRPYRDAEIKAAVEQERTRILGLAATGYSVFGIERDLRNKALKENGHG